MPRDLSDHYSNLLKDPQERETRHMNPDGKFPIQADAGLGTARDLSSVYLYRGTESSGMGPLQKRFYSTFKGPTRRDALRSFDTQSLLARKEDISTTKNLPRISRADSRSKNPYFEGDLSDPDKEKGIGSKILAGAVVAGVLFSVYRGSRGAGFLPIGNKFWRPLSKDIVFKKPIKIPEVRLPWLKDPWIKARTIRGYKSVRSLNITTAAERATEVTHGVLDKLSGTARAKYFEQLAHNKNLLGASSFGLRGKSESFAHLLSRPIESITEFIQYAGFEKTGKKLSVIPKWILGGETSALPGFAKAPQVIRDTITGAGFRAGARTPLGVVGRVASRVILPAYAAMLAYNYADYRIRRSEAFDSTPLSGGITEAGAGMWVKSRMFMQKTLENLGILDMHKGLQTRFPGYLRAAGLAVGLATGIRAGSIPGAGGQKYLSNIIRSFFGGALGYAAEKGLNYSPEQLERIYSGKEDIEVRKGRWWEFGRTAFSGGGVSYYRQHWYPLLKSKYREQGTLYPDEDWKWQNHWLIGRLTGHKVDPYAWEKKYYEERPYPVTASAFEGVPLIGPALEATLGNIVKPRKLMHTEEWMAPEGMVDQPDKTERIRRMPSDVAETLQLEGIPRGGMGEVTTPADIKNLIGEQQYRLTEWFGLPGFYLQEVLRTATGQESLLEKSRLESADRATGYERDYWDRDLGGLLGTTEIFRRFFPHRRRQIEEYNPIENLLGKRHPWLPGSEYFVDFKHGDPYIKVPMGEARLPGTGYETLHELHSTIPGVYDPVDRLLILADIAPYSEQYKHYRTIVNMWSRAGIIDESWKGKVDTAKEQRQKRMKRYEFQPRRFSRITQQVEDALTNDNESKIGEGASRLWEDVTHTLSNVPLPGISYLFGKLMPNRTAIEHYERFQVFGRESSSWGNPYRDFIKVYGQEIRGKVQPDWIPKDVENRREIEEYFDKLEYIKYKQLQKRAVEVEEYETAREFEKRSKETLHGLDPFGSWANILRAMPRAERDYFDTFSEARGEERERIRKISPDYMSRIYEAQWKIRDRRAGIEPERRVVERQTNEDLSTFFAEHHLPGPNWLGWHPDVDLDKVKLKVVKNEGMDIHDFNLWRTQEAESKREQIPNIRDFRTPNPQYDTPVLRRDLIESLTRLGFDIPDIEITTQPSDKRRVNIDFDVSYDQSDKFLQRAKGIVPLTV